LLVVLVVLVVVLVLVLVVLVVVVVLVVGVWVVLVVELVLVVVLTFTTGSPFLCALRKPFCRMSEPHARTWTISAASPEPTLTVSPTANPLDPTTCSVFSPAGASTVSSVFPGTLSPMPQPVGGVGAPGLVVVVVELVALTVVDELVLVLVVVVHHGSSSSTTHSACVNSPSMHDDAHLAR